MPETFQYKVKDKGGKLVEGSIEAETADLVVSKLRSMGYVPINITQQSGVNVNKELKLPGLSDRIKLKDIVDSTGSTASGSRAQLGGRS